LIKKTQRKKPHRKLRQSWVDLKDGGRIWATFIWPRKGKMNATCEHCNGLIVFIIEVKFLE
jgi:hypothetical protein